MSLGTAPLAAVAPVSVASVTAPLAAVALVMVGLAAAAEPAWADARGERPIQMQVDGYGLSLGWHISELIYVGFTHRGQTGAYHVQQGQHDDPDEIYGQRGVQDADLELGERNALEIRFSPWEHGFYFAVGVLRVFGDSQDVLYDERARVVGDGAYVTGIRLRIQGKPKTAGALGFGFNYVADFGLSLGAGVLIGLDQPEPPDIEITVTNPDVLQSDIDKFRAEVQGDFTDSPFLFHLAIGYNF